MNTSRKPVTEDIAKRCPVDRTASLVSSRGLQYESGKVILSKESIAPFPLKETPTNTPCLIGIRRGRLVVLGLASEYNGQWACRCDCGMYVLRRAKALKNPANPDRCEECRHLAYLKRHEEFLRTGRNTDNTGWN